MVEFEEGEHILRLQDVEFFEQTLGELLLYPQQIVSVEILPHRLVLAHIPLLPELVVLGCGEHKHSVQLLPGCSLTSLSQPQHKDC